MARRKTPEEVAWLESEYPKAPTPDVAAAFEERFGWPLPAERINDWASGRGLRKLHRALRWADHPEYDGFLREFTAGHSEREIIAAFRGRFGVTLTEAQLGNRKAKLGLRSGTAGGRFEKGNVPHNKGRTWDELGIPEESRRRMRGGQFKAGAVPWTGDLYPVGSERVGADGYVEVKVRERSPVPCTNRCWELKHRLVWQEANGRELRDDECVVFVDQDRTNLDPGNLRAITRAQNIALQRMGRPYADDATLDTALRIAELKGLISRAERAPRPCAECGEEFNPRYARQRTCDACLAKRKKGR